MARHERSFACTRICRDTSCLSECGAGTKDTKARWGSWLFFFLLYLFRAKGHTRRGSPVPHIFNLVFFSASKCAAAATPRAQCVRHVSRTSAARAFRDGRYARAGAGQISMKAWPARGPNQRRSAGGRTRTASARREASWHRFSRLPLGAAQIDPSSSDQARSFRSCTRVRVHMCACVRRREGPLRSPTATARHRAGAGWELAGDSDLQSASVRPSGRTGILARPPCRRLRRSRSRRSPASRSSSLVSTSARGERAAARVLGAFLRVCVPAHPPCTL